MLSTQHKKYIIKHFVIVSAFINASINGAIAYALFSAQPQIGLWGEPSLAVDIIATVFLLTLITSLLVNWSTALAIDLGRIEAIDTMSGCLRLAERLPQSPWPRALLCSVVATALIAPGVIYSFDLLAIESLSSGAAMMFKTLFAVAAGVLVTPVIGLLALQGRAI